MPLYVIMMCVITPYMIQFDLCANVAQHVNPGLMPVAQI